jgi:type I restriction enzyme S subunit
VTAELLIRELERASQASGAISRLRLLILNVAASGRLVRSEPTRRLNSAGQGLSWEVPGHWDVVPFADLTGIGGTFVDGDWVESKDQDPSGDVRLTQLADVGVGHFRDRSSRFMRREVADRLNCTYLNPGDILIARMPDPLGRACIFPGDPSSCVTVVDVAMLRTARTDVDGGFVVQVLNSSLFGALVASKASGTTRQRISRGNLGRLPFPLPPLVEQHRIVAKVDELMAMCDELEAAQTKREARRDRLRATSLRSLVAPEEPKANARFFLRHSARMITRPEHVVGVRQAILDLAVRGRLVPQDPGDEPAAELLRRNGAPLSQEGPGPVEEPYALPGGWKWTPFGRLITASDAGWSPKTESFPRQGDRWAVLKVSAVSWNSFRPEENKQLLPGVVPRLEFQVGTGDFLISRANTSELVAKAVFVEQAPPNLMLSDKTVRLRLVADCAPRYLLIVNNHAPHARAYYAREASGVSPSMKNVSREVICRLAVPLPPLAEQHRIVAKVDELMAVCDELEQSLATEQTERARLLESLLHDVLEDALPARELELSGPQYRM